MCAAVKTLVTWDGDQLVCVQKGEKENRGWKQWIVGDLLHVVREPRDEEGGAMIRWCLTGNQIQIQSLQYAATKIHKDIGCTGVLPNHR